MISPHRLSRLITAVLHERVKKATVYLGPKEVVKATYFGEKDRRSRQETVTVTFGAPNWRERQFIKKRQRAGESFPMRGLRVKLVKGK